LINKKYLKNRNEKSKHVKFKIKKDISLFFIYFSNVINYLVHIFSISFYQPSLISHLGSIKDQCPRVID